MSQSSAPLSEVECEIQKNKLFSYSQLTLIHGWPLNYISKLHCSLACLENPSAGTTNLLRQKGTRRAPFPPASWSFIASFQQESLIHLSFSYTS